MEQICRLCFNDGPNLDPINSSSSDCMVEAMVGEEATSQDLVQLIFRYLSIQVIKDESPSKSWICWSCRTAIEEWHNFHQVCLRNDEIYQQKQLQQQTRPQKEEYCERDQESGTTTVEIEISLKQEDGDEGDFEGSADEDLTFEPVEVLDEGNGSDSSSEQEIAESSNKKVPLKKRGRPRKANFEKDVEAAKLDEDYEEDTDTDKKIAKRKRGRPKEEKRAKRVEVCTICGKFIKNLPEHMRIHNNEKRHQCPYCPKAFVSASNYNSHVNIHTRAKMYKCNMCEKEYVMLNSLKQHQKTHLKERIYLCPVCGKAYYQPTGLARHKRTHFEEPKIKCPECDKMFLSNGDLKKHFSKHLAEKPFHCEVCNRGFSRKDNLRTHMKTHRTVSVESVKKDLEAARVEATITVVGEVE